MSDNRITPGGLLLVGGRLCLDFCNTVTERFSEKPHDMLGKNRYQALVYWSREVDALPGDTADKLMALDEAQPEITQAVFDSAVVLRDALYRVGVAAKDGTEPPPDALAVLNIWMQQAMAQRELHRADGHYAWHWRDPDSPERMLWEITTSAVDFFTPQDTDFTRLRQCPGCGWLFYDHSRNNSRTWCDMRFCGNRAKNKEFHKRRKNEE